MLWDTVNYFIYQYEINNIYVYIYIYIYNVYI